MGVERYDFGVIPLFIFFISIWKQRGVRLLWISFLQILGLSWSTNTKSDKFRIFADMSKYLTGQLENYLKTGNIYSVAQNLQIEYDYESNITSIVFFKRDTFGQRNNSKKETKTGYMS